MTVSPPCASASQLANQTVHPASCHHQIDSFNRPFDPSNMPEALPSVPSFSEQQVHDLANIIHSVMQQYFAPSNQITSASIPASHDQPPSISPAPQETQKEEDEQLLQLAIAENTTEKQEHQPLYQATVKSILSTIPRRCTARSSRDSAACLSNALLLACQHVMFLNTLLDYIEHSKGLEATGQG